ncbi:hypothetical protein MTR67_036954 [Solanum verrucosum]|uniref:Uncharacterized protein n=1 Tax=Solanum verrucosum TaxID=315347 RepID=A0AAF0UD04_SOLVR|nr:hypothetical protein MTR67_036954 [Solanum verrucosum]
MYLQIDQIHQLLITRRCNRRRFLVLKTFHQNLRINC